MENDISPADSAILAANDLELRQKDEEIFVSLINGKSVMGEGNPPCGWKYDTRLARNEISRERKRKRERERESLFDDPMNCIP